MTDLLSGLMARIRSAIGGRAADRRAQDEFAFHLAMETERNLARGMSPAEARRLALVAFGGVQGHREAMRDGRGFRWVAELLQDARLTLRMLGREPAFGLSVVGTLALAIGATTAIFSLFRVAVLEPLPYPRAGELVQLSTRYAGWGIAYGSVSPPEAADLASATATFASVAAYRPGAMDLAADGGAVRIRGLRASPQLLDVLGVQPAAGRGFTVLDDAPGAPNVALVTDAVRQRLGPDAAGLGRVVRLNGEPFEIIGLLPASFDFAQAGILVPLRLGAPDPRTRSQHYLRVVGRRAPATSPARLAADLAALSTRLRTDFPQNYVPDMRWSLVAQPLRDAVLGGAGDVLEFLAGVVVLVLVIACANIANLLLARTDRREREMALRTALGAGRARLVRQLLTEGMVLSLIGAAIGIVVATLGANALLGLAPGAVPRAERLTADLAMLATATAVAGCCALCFGLVPALRGTRGAERGAASFAGARGANVGGRRAGQLMSAVVGAEFALAVVVLVSAGLLVRTYESLARVDLGFAPDSVLAFDITLPEAHYGDSVSAPRFFASLRARLAAEPGVTAVGGISSLPLRSGTGNIDIEVEDHPVPPGQSPPSPLIQVATPGYFEAMRIPVKQGRAPSESDDARGPLAAWVNEAAAARLWPGETPLGRRFRFAGDSGDTWFTVAGVVGNVRTVGAGREPQWEYFIPEAQVPRAIGASEFYRSLSMVVRGSGDAAALAAPVRRAVAALDPAVAPAQLETMDAVVLRSLARQRLAALLLAAFGLLAAALAAVGVAGVLSYGVATRRKEIGIRVALGATRAAVVRAVAAGGLLPAAGGLVAGVCAAMAVSRVVASQLFGVGPLNAPVYAESVLALLALAVLATVAPARRAWRIDPVASLRADS